MEETTRKYAYKTKDIAKWAEKELKRRKKQYEDQKEIALNSPLELSSFNGALGFDQGMIFILEDLKRKFPELFEEIKKRR